MQIQVNTDNHTEGSQDLAESARELVQDKLRRFADRITRVEIQLTDENSSAKAGPNDIRCVMEARMSGMQPISVTDQGDSPEDALRGAVGKLQRLIESTLGKLGKR